MLNHVLNIRLKPPNPHRGNVQSYNCIFEPEYQFIRLSQKFGGPHNGNELHSLNTNSTRHRGNVDQTHAAALDLHAIIVGNGAFLQDGHFNDTRLGTRAKMPPRHKRPQSSVRLTKKNNSTTTKQSTREVYKRGSFLHHISDTSPPEPVHRPAADA